MKRILPFALVALGISIGVFAQGGRRGAAPPAPPAPLEPGATQADVDKALIAAPAALRDQATVIKWKPDFTYDTLRRERTDSSATTVGDAAAAAVLGPVHEQRQSDREAQNLKAEATGDRAKSEAMLKSLEDNGTRAKPEYGSLWYHVAGADKDHVSPHEVTIAVPGATSASIGLPDKRRENGAWLMNAGTSTAHIMIPGR